MFFFWDDKSAPPIPGTPGFIAPVPVREYVLYVREDVEGRTPLVQCVRSSTERVGWPTGSGGAKEINKRPAVRVLPLARPSSSPVAGHASFLARPLASASACSTGQVQLFCAALWPGCLVVERARARTRVRRRGRVLPRPGNARAVRTYCRHFVTRAGFRRPVANPLRDRSFVGAYTRCGHGGLFRKQEAAPPEAERPRSMEPKRGVARQATPVDDAQ